LRSTDGGVSSPATRKSSGMTRSAKGSATAISAIVVTGASVTSRTSEYDHQSNSEYPTSACPAITTAIRITLRLSR
jgi:hypothetical protein